ncbi:hypothetical protein [Nonomuraea typhae]|uniref:hypothetical protein n=1 Tax=Nonomuraea typhae TaxID=2603600 RepID=UPI0012FC67B1|nr:hypothetical protein [Nonomuraea typhae]
MSNTEVEARGSKLRRRVVTPLAVLGAAVAVATAIVTPASADSGRNGSLWIRAHSGVVDSQHYPGPPSGTYHIQYWQAGGGWSANGRDYHFPGRTVYGRIAAPVPSGATVCAQLWYHKPEGGYGSYGLPCVRMS